MSLTTSLKIALSAASLTLAAPVANPLLQLTAEDASSQTYYVGQMRATPGGFKPLLEHMQTVNWAALELDAPILMRHSQGDHWDLMSLFGDTKPCSNDACEQARKDHHAVIDQYVDYYDEFYAASTTSWADLKAFAAASNIFHIEMFSAAAGKKAALNTEREMENAYLVATGRKANAIFNTTFGSDIDNFTVGFYKDMTEFAYTPDLPEAAFEKAAVDAGFKDRADISFALRELIVSHHDTIATNAKK